MYCWNCGVRAADGAAFCPGCGASLSGQNAAVQQASRDNSDLGLLIPVNVSPWALASGYLGLFAVLLVPAPLALLTGILALRDIKNNPKRAGKGRAIFGIIMGSLCSIGLIALIISLLTAQFAR